MAEEITYKINLDAQAMENSLKDINTEITTLNQSTKDLEASQTQLKNSGKENSEAFTKNATNIKNNEKQVGKLNKEYKSTDKTLQSTTKSTDKMSKSAAGATKSTGKMGTTMGKSAGMFGKFGGIIGSLPKLLQGAMGAVRAFGVVVAANPIGLIVTAIVLLMGLMVAALSKFKPITEWISDQIAGISAMIDTFVNSLEAIGEIIKLIFQGDFKEAAKAAGELAKAMGDAADAQKEYNKTLRETAVERAVNDATTARAMTKMKELDAIIKDTTKSEVDRLKASKDLAKEKLGQVNDDFNTTKKLADAEIKLLRDKHATAIKAWEDENGRTLSTIEDIGKLTKAKAQFRDDGIKIINQMKNVEEDRAKITEVETNTIREQNKIRLKGLADTLKALKSQVKYNEAKNKSVLEGEAELTQDLIDEETKRLVNNQKMLLRIAKQEHDARLVAAGSNTALIQEANYIYATTRIKINEDTNKQILKNDELFMKQQLTALEIQSKLYLEQNKRELKDTTIATQKEVDDRVKIYKELLKKNKVIIEEKATIEKWSAEKLKLELLKIDNKYIDDVDKLNDIKTKNQEKTDADLLKLKIETDKKLAETEAQKQQDTIDMRNENFNQVMSISNQLMAFNDAQRDLELTKINKKYSDEDKLAERKFINDKKRLEKQYKDGLLTESQYTSKLDKLDENFNKAKTDRNEDQLKAENEAKEEAFNKNKKFQIANVIMNAASAIIGTWAGYAEMGPAGAILAGIQTAIIAADAVIQTSTISNTEYAAGGGILNGPLHAAGGINMGDVEAEGGEYIINRASTQRYTPLLNSINSAGNTNGDSTNTSDIIDYERLANVLQSKKVYVVSHDISDQQTEDIDIKTSVEF